MSTIRKSPLDAKLHKIDSLCSIDQKYCSTKQVETKQNRDRKKCTNMMCTASSQFGLACSLHCIAYCISMPCHQNLNDLNCLKIFKLRISKRLKYNTGPTRTLAVVFLQNNDKIGIQTADCPFSLVFGSCRDNFGDKSLDGLNGLSHKIW